jgi:flagellar protein FlgJ
MNRTQLNAQTYMPISMVESTLEKKEQQELRHVVQEFEAVFLDLLFKQMQKAIPRDGYLGVDSGTRLYEEMFYEELAKSISKTGGIGLGERLYEDLVKHVTEEHR